MRKSRIKHVRRASKKTKSPNKIPSYKLDRNIYRMSAWSNVMKGEPVFILGNAPSTTDWDLNSLDNFFTIGINKILDLYDPTILFWQDIAFWKDYHGAIMKAEAVKVSRVTSDPKKVACHFKICGEQPRLTAKPNTLYGYGSSGYLAVQLAYAMGCRDIVLVGCDCCHRGDDTNFYGINKYHKTYSMKNCRSSLKWVREEDYKNSINIFNCSDNSLWPKQELPDVVNNFGRYTRSKDYFKAKLLQAKYNRK